VTIYLRAAVAFLNGDGFEDGVRLYVHGDAVAERCLHKFKLIIDFDIMGADDKFKCLAAVLRISGSLWGISEREEKLVNVAGGIMLTPHKEEWFSMKGFLIR